MEKKMYACWLNGVPGIGNRTINKLLELCGSEKEIYLAGEKLWRRVLNKRQLEQMVHYAEIVTPGQLLKELAEKNIRFVIREEMDYPERLKKIPDPPYGLYVKGRFPENDLPSVAVIGARDCSEYGNYVAAALGNVLGKNGVQVISGMARGIDGISQNAALEAGGSSFGVLGCGVDVCYPATNRALYERLCECGGVISAYPPGTEARPGNFPPRNRIVSGLSDILVVVEARNKSGTLITVDMALEQGKDVYVVPGRVTDRLSDGCNALIRQGASVFVSPEELLNEIWERWNYSPFRKNVKENGKSNLLQWRPEGVAEGLNLQGREIYEALGFDPMTPEMIQSKLSENHTIPQIMSILMELCLNGHAIQVGAGHFVRKNEIG